MKRVTKLFNTKATSINDVEKTVTFTISDNGVDRMGEIVDQKSWNFKDYLKNPIVLFGHDPSKAENVLGTAQSLEIAKDGNSTIANLKFDADFNPMANLVFNQVKAGTLRCVSVGFINHSEDRENDTPVLKDNDLLEISVVPIPANPRAIALSLKEGTLSTKDATWLMDSMKKEMTFIEEQLEQEETNDKDSDAMNEQATKQLSAMLDAVTALTNAQAKTNENIDTLATRLDGLATAIEVKKVEIPVTEESDDETDTETSTDETVEKGTPSTSLPTADPDVAWDSSKATANVKAWASDSDGNINWTKYAKAFFWFDSSAPDPDGDGLPDKQGDYKLPFADVIDGKLTAVWKGVAAAYAAVNGARGGTDISDADKTKVLAQIKKYYKKFGKDWPAKAFDLANPDITTKDLDPATPPTPTDPVTSPEAAPAAPTTPPADPVTPPTTPETPVVTPPSDPTESDPAKGGSDDQPGAGDDEDIDLDAEVTPELEEKIGKQLETPVANK